ncbi:hypothetical protein SAMN04488074_109254 [Lentzea albidocapillata subsp. violacea]|uniref:Excreted virulence factor EspC, type VII ESX diderm n=1 Tax=Lentzea albidocapillata subsp. violacea TaxID=128104 RepID=A0A1G9I3F8_9PSEU|nr:hypothetical protein [Lentzea albidocapillata]SDL19768.1 hypothetical protein SAMN04488074_109254 [Lentzea albidocapillata subsp. violacea]
MSGFQVDLAALEAHERELKALLASLPSAADAGADYVGNPQAWGIVGMFFAQIMERWTNDAREYVDTVKAAGDDVVERFAGMRQTYAEQDEAIAQSFKKLREGLDGVQP